MRKINPMLIAAAAVGVGAFAMSRKKKGGEKLQSCKLYVEEGFQGYHIDEATAKKVAINAKPLIMAGNTDVDALAIEVLSIIDSSCDWAEVMNGGGDAKAEAVLANVQDIIFNLIAAAPPGA